MTGEKARCKCLAILGDHLWTFQSPFGFPDFASRALADDRCLGDRRGDFHLSPAKKPAGRPVTNYTPFLPRKPRVGCLRTSRILWENSTPCWESFFPPRCSRAPVNANLFCLFFMRASCCKSTIRKILIPVCDGNH